MIGWLRRLSLSRQLVLMTVFVSTLVLTIALGVLMELDSVMYLGELGDHLAGVAEVVADANVAPLVFDDAQAARTNLAGLGGNSLVLAVSILDETGEVFAEYLKPGAGSGPGRGAVIRADEPRGLGLLGTGLRSGSVLRVARPIHLDGERIGGVVVFGELSRLDARRESYLVIFASMLAVFSGVAFVCAAVLQRAITEPLRSLATNMRRVSEEGDYSIRSESVGENDLGTLIAVFNEMLDQIESQNSMLAEHRDHLEEVVAQRTGELKLAQRDLEATVERTKAATEVAEAASLAKSDFLARMSHEIRTPLNGVLGMLELVGQSELSPGQKGNIDAALKSGRSLLQVISEILDFSKIEAGSLTLEQVEFELRDTLHDAVEMFAESAHSRGLELTCFVDDEVPERAIGDPVRLGQILVNLVSNAVKFTEQGEVSVTVEVGVPVEPSVNLKIRVRDTGRGIPPHLRKDLFEAFAQADVSITRKFGGTGLGLAIARELTRAMGGHIGFETDPIRGTSFEFSVVLGAPQSGITYPPAHYPRLRGTHVLVACGAVTTRTILETYMRSWQVEVDHFGSSNVAAELPAIDEATREVVLLLDADLPRQPALDLVELVGDRLVEATVHVIWLVSPSGSEERDGLPGMCLAKPTRRADLAEALVACLDGRGFDDAAPVPLRLVASPAFDLRILLAEDNAVNQEVALGMLGVLGCRIDVVEHGEDAVRHAGDHPYDLIFMDCQMPMMDGYQATLRIRCDEQAAGGERVPIVALTAHAEHGARDKCIAAGMDDYLAKPFTVSDLAEVLERWCGSPAAPIPRQAEPAEASGTGGRPAGVLEAAVLEKLRSLPSRDGSGLLGRVLTAYRETSPGLMEKLREAVAGDSAELVGDRAHALKSCSENVGALEFASLCRQLESRARNNPEAGWDDLFRQVEDVFPRVLEATEAELPEVQAR